MNWDFPGLPLMSSATTSLSVTAPTATLQALTTGLFYEPFEFSSEGVGAGFTVGTNSKLFVAFSPGCPKWRTTRGGDQTPPSTGGGGPDQPAPTVPREPFVWFDRVLTLSSHIHPYICGRFYPRAVNRVEERNCGDQIWAHRWGWYWFSVQGLDSSLWLMWRVVTCCDLRVVGKGLVGFILGSGFEARPGRGIPVGSCFTCVPNTCLAVVSPMMGTHLKQREPYFPVFFPSFLWFFPRLV